MKTKIIPFDIELAKKIQAGEIEGKIITERGEKILLYENDSNEFKCWIHEKRDGIHIAYGNSEVLNLLKLYLEVPDNEPQFKPFDKVLVRKDGGVWCCAFFSHMDYSLVTPTVITTDDNAYKHCIPYEGNQELVGTCNEPKCK